jgi:hypothetical protein
MVSVVNQVAAVVNFFYDANVVDRKGSESAPRTKLLIFVL